MPPIPSPTQASTLTAGLQEIFSSIQGEGPYVGKRQIFVRFNACHLHCVYCDSPQRPAAQPCEIETHPGSAAKELVNNPMTVDTVRTWIQHFHTQAAHHSISFTGGEPLLYTAFLKKLLPDIATDLPVYLETSGTQPDKLQDILSWVSIIAMDIKLPSTTQEPMQLENHQAFYALGQDKELFIKLVFSEQTTPEELEAVRHIVTNPATPIILQPVTSLDTGESQVSAQTLLTLHQTLDQWFDDVRVIPQTHKALNLL